jgi:hypothetical protein
MESIEIPQNMGLHPAQEHNPLSFNGFLSKKAGAAGDAALRETGSGYVK